ncbi:MAG: hypothetical protein JWM27_3380 [Gemmatimonadetes bacterium]|nr:hypothetical protein [Gemmatimonadota bacterium]
MRPLRPIPFALALLLALAAAACNRAGGEKAAAANAPADSTAAAAQRVDTLPPGVTVDTQKVAGEAAREAPQPDEEP